MLWNFSRQPAFAKLSDDRKIEQRVPHVRSFDVLAQYLVTLAVSEGFIPEKVLEEIRQTFCFQSISDEEWNWLLSFISTGGSLHAYDEYKKVNF
jgi:ATP-dependent Lhr-like helicase